MSKKPFIIAIKYCARDFVLMKYVTYDILSDPFV